MDDLFSAAGERRRAGHAPLAERMRPATLTEFVGQEHLLGQGHLLKQMVEARELHSLILWGPPGCGKTTLARLLAGNIGASVTSLSAVLSGVKDIRKAVEDAERRWNEHSRATVLFIDEIHRFNKAQQDALLPHVEKGTVTLLGATTENPSFEVIAPLLSRTRVLTLEPLMPNHVSLLCQRALEDHERGLGTLALSIDEDALAFLVESTDGDVRSALSTLEIAAHGVAQRKDDTITLAAIEEARQQRTLSYDKGGEEHYNVISAFIKSLRDSDPDAAIYWLFRMIEAGEDPLFVARRMVILAAEDIGTADPQALVVANAVKDAVHFIGMPEGRIPLASGAAYLASAPKSNAAYAAMNRAIADIRAHGALPVPKVMRNAPTKLMKEMGYGQGYRYAHDEVGNVVTQQHLPDALEGHRYYEPTENGFERQIRDWLTRRK